MADSRNQPAHLENISGEAWIIPGHRKLRCKYYYTNVDTPPMFTRNPLAAARFASPQDAAASMARAKSAHHCPPVHKDLLVFRLSSVLERDALNLDELIDGYEWIAL